jgi:hypothetical protein
MPVKRVVANWGYASLMPSVIKTAARPDVDVMICIRKRDQRVPQRAWLGLKKPEDGCEMSFRVSLIVAESDHRVDA